MKLLSFKAKNLFSLGDVSLDLDNRGLLLITGYSVDEGGANGSGKSSLSNKGLLWTLFGKTAGGERADAVINRFAPEGEETFGEIELESTSGGRFRIHRSRNPARLLLYDVDSSKNISATTEKETQVLINKILGRTRDTFIQTDFFGQGKSASFLDLTPKAQVELLEGILPFEQLNELGERTKQSLAFVRASKDKAIAKAAEVQGQLQECQRQERVLSTSVDKWETDQLVTIERLTTQLAELQVTGAVHERMKQIEDWFTINPNQQHLNELMAEANVTLEELDKYVKTYKDIIAQADRDEYNLVVAPRPTNASCPTCGTVIDSALFKKLTKEYEIYDAQWSTIDASKQTAIGYLEQVDAAIRVWRSTLTDCHKARTDLDAKQRELTVLQVETSTLKVAQLESALEDAKLTPNPYTLLYDENTKRLNQITGYYNSAKSKVDELTKEQLALEFWVSAFNRDLKNELLKQVCPFLEQKSNIHLSALWNGQLTVKFQTTKTLKSNDERTEFTVSVSSATGGGTFDALSGGEKQMASFSVGMALADLAESQVDGPSLLAILDEPFVALDGRNSESVVNYLQTYLSKKKDTILLVSNEEALKMLIPNQVRVIKENGISRLE